MEEVVIVTLANLVSKPHYWDQMNVNRLTHQDQGLSQCLH